MASELIPRLDPATWEVVDESAILRGVEPIVQEAFSTSLLIDCQDMYEIAGELLTKVKTYIDSADKERRTITDPLNKIVKIVNDKYRPTLERGKAAEDVLKKAMTAHLQRVEEESRRLRIEADKKARAEQDRIEAAAKKAREEAAWLERDAAQKAAAAKNDEDRRDAEAAAAVAQLATQTAAELDMDAAIPVAAVATANDKPKARGTSAADVYGAELLDSAAVLHYVADNPQWHAYVDIKMGLFDKLAQAQKEAFRFPGMALKKSKRISARKS